MWFGGRHHCIHESHSQREAAERLAADLNHLVKAGMVVRLGMGTHMRVLGQCEKESTHIVRRRAPT